MVNINFFGGPGVGKSTVARDLVNALVKSGIKAEYCHEIAKDHVYSKDFFTLKDQLMIFAKQRHLVWKLHDQVDYTVNDGPFLLGMVYYQPTQFLPEKAFKDFLLKVWNTYDNLNIFLEKGNYDYQEYGRNQTSDESNEIHSEIKQMLIDNLVSFHTLTNDAFIVEKILKLLEEHEKNSINRN